MHDAETPYLLGQLIPYDVDLVSEGIPEVEALSTVESSRESQ